MVYCHLQSTPDPEKLPITVINAVIYKTKQWYLLTAGSFFWPGVNCSMRSCCFPSPVYTTSSTEYLLLVSLSSDDSIKALHSILVHSLDLYSIMISNLAICSPLFKRTPIWPFNLPNWCLKIENFCFISIRDALVGTVGCKRDEWMRGCGSPVLSMPEWWSTIVYRAIATTVNFTAIVLMPPKLQQTAPLTWQTWILFHDRHHHVFIYIRNILVGTWRPVLYILERYSTLIHSVIDHATLVSLLLLC